MNGSDAMAVMTLKGTPKVSAKVMMFYEDQTDVTIAPTRKPKPPIPGVDQTPEGQRDPMLVSIYEAALTFFACKENEMLENVDDFIMTPDQLLSQGAPSPLHFIELLHLSAWRVPCMYVYLPTFTYKETAKCR